MTIIEQIKTKIDKLYCDYKDKFHQFGDQYHLGLIDGLDMAERVLDAIESEKPMQEELEEEIQHQVYDLLFDLDGVAIKGATAYATVDDVAYIARHFAKWGAEHAREQMMSNAVEGTVYGNGVYTWVAGDIPSQFKYGDKVRVIVLPKKD